MDTRAGPRAGVEAQRPGTDGLGRPGADPVRQLEVRAVSKSFGGVRAVRGVDLAVGQGSIVSVIGPNGAGKTTVLNMISGFYRPEEGSIVFEGTEITRLAPSRIAALGVARTFQNVALFRGLTVLDNLMLGRHVHMRTGVLAGMLYVGRGRREEVEHRAAVEDVIEIPGITPGFGRADATDGRVWPYIFPLAATYWSQMGGAMQYIKENGGKKGAKVAFLFQDNPAGREPIKLFERICEQEGYTCRIFAVPLPGVEMGAQVLDITRRMRADWVVAHLFGRSPSVSIKELKKNGFPMDRVISFVWGSGEADMTAAGWDTAQGYLGLQFAGVGRQFPVIEEIMKMYRDGGREVPAQVGSVYYNRGVLVAALMVEAVRLAVEREGMPLTGEKMKKGYERIKDFSLGGFLPPLTVTESDHEGGGWVRVYQTRGTEVVAKGDWFRGYREIVQDEVKKAPKP